MLLQDIQAKTGMVGNYDIGGAAAVNRDRRAIHRKRGGGDSYSQL